MIPPHCTLALQAMMCLIASSPAEGQRPAKVPAPPAGFFLFPQADGTTLVGHTGEQAGFRSFVYLNPRTSLAVVGAVNTTNEALAEASSAAWIAITHQARTLVAQ
jgi:hypothetical protein